MTNTTHATPPESQAVATICASLRRLALERDADAERRCCREQEELVFVKMTSTTTTTQTKATTTSTTAVPTTTTTASREFTQL